MKEKTMLRLRTVWLPGFMTVVLGAGCVIDETDDSAFAVAWDLVYVEEQGRVTCEDAGTPWVSIQARHLYTNSLYTGEFDCSALQGITQVLPHGPYEATLSLLDQQRRPVSLISGPFDIHRHGLTELPEIQFQIQTWELEWILIQTTPGGQRSASCAEVGARTVELETQLASEPREKYIFPCEDGGGISQAIRTGTYAYQVRLLDGAGAPISETLVMSYRVPDRNQALLQVSFEVN
jgi:hypothetical protein